LIDFGLPIEYAAGQVRERPTMENALLTIEGLAALLHRSPESLYVQRSRNPDSLPPALRVGRRLYWRHQTIDAWLEELETKQPA
jgi:predicted DNA-binding transcriptional regulator AlpA